MNLAGATTKIGLSVTIDIPGSGTYTAETTGGTADPSQSDAKLLTGGPNAPKGAFYFNKNGISNAGAACSGGTCALGVNGGILGLKATRRYQPPLLGRIGADGAFTVAWASGERFVPPKPVKVPKPGFRNE